jgi:membrane-associated phospholipid phosphatase
LSGIDHSVFEWFVDHREPWLTTVMQVLTILGGSAFLIPLAIAVGAWFRWRAGTWRPLVLLSSAYLGALILSNSIKALADRGRPPASLAIGTYDSPAFPSGHATHAAAVWIMVGIVVAASLSARRRRVGTWIAVGTIIGLVGVSRLYLAAHWLTDVFAGWAIGGLWALLLTAIAQRPGPARPVT